MNGSLLCRFLQGMISPNGAKEVIMKKLLLLTATLAACAGATLAGETPAALSGLEIGTRILHIQLQEDSRGAGTDTRRDNFLGSLDTLDENQDYVPNRLYIQYFFDEYVLGDYLGFGISYDAVEAKTVDEGGGDGDVGVSGPILYVVGRYPNSSAFVPFAEIGVAFYHAYFEENDWAFDEGDPTHRRMENEDTTALVLALGCDYAITENLSANIYGRIVEGATIDAADMNKGDPDPHAEGEFPLDYYGVGIGIKYSFK